MNKKLFFLILFLFLYNCQREPNPFTYNSVSPEDLKNIKSLVPVNFNAYGVYANYELISFDSEYENKMKGYKIYFISDWSNFANSPEEGELKKFEFLIINNGIIEYSSDLDSGDILSGFYCYEFNIKMPFYLQYYDNQPPAISKIYGPMNANITKFSPPEIYIEVTDPAPSEGITLPRYYTIFSVDYYGNISAPYKKLVSPVRVNAIFYDESSMETVYLSVAEVVKFEPTSQVYLIKLCFDPRIFTTDEYGYGFKPGKIYFLNSVFVYDLVGNSKEVYLSGNIYLSDAQNVGAGPIKFKVSY